MKFEFLKKLNSKVIVIMVVAVTPTDMNQFNS